MHVGKMLVVTLLFVASFLMSYQSFGADETDPIITVNVPAGDLDGALIQFSKAASVDFLYTPEVVANLKSNAVVGRFKRNEAIGLLLKGLPLSVKITGTSVAISKAPSNAPPTLPEVIVEGNKTSAEKLPTPAEPARKPYLRSQASTATKTDTPIAEVPASIQVVTEQVMKDQAATRLEDVFSNISGVKASGNTQNALTASFPIIRGFEAQDTLRNGMRSSFLGTADLVNVERVEVLKGPASILYGSLECGGALNFVTKKPQSIYRHVLEQQFGSYENFRTTVDSTGPINKDKTLLYRVNAAYTNSGSFRDEMHVERTVIAPSLTYIIGPHTEVTFDSSFSHETQPYDIGVPFSPKGQRLVPIDTFFGDEDLEGRVIDDTFASYQLQHQITDDWKFRNSFQFHRRSSENEAMRGRTPVSTNAATGGFNLNRRYQNEHQTDDQYQLVTDVIGKLEAGITKHEVLFGFDLNLQEQNFKRFRVNAPAIPISSNPNTDFNVPARTPRGLTEQEIRWASFYAQDQISFFDDGRLKLLLGGRIDYVETEQAQTGLPFPTIYDFAPTGRAGLLYQVMDEFSPYVSVSQSFKPQFPGAVDQTNTPLDPEEGLQYEAGAKMQFFKKQLQANLSVYNLVKKNVAVFDAAFSTNSDFDAYFPGVEVRSRGVEFDLTGNLTRELSIIANYAYTDTKNLKNGGDRSVVGDRFNGVPLSTGRVWLAYNFSEKSELKGFGFGGGVRFSSESSANFDTTPLPGFATVDMGIWYRRELTKVHPLKALRVQFNVNNLLDKEYYPKGDFAPMITPGAPRTFTGSIGFEF